MELFFQIIGFIVCIFITLGFLGWVWEVLYAQFESVDYLREQNFRLHQENFELKKEIKEQKNALIERNDR